MRGITNAPQGGGSSGGGEWTLHTSTDWSDVLEINGSDIIAKYDILIIANTSSYTANGYIPKGFTRSSILIPVTGMNLYSNSLRFFNYLNITTNNIASSTIGLSRTLFSFTTDGSTVTVSSGASGASENKSNLRLYYK